MCICGIVKIGIYTPLLSGDAEHVSLNHRLASPYQGVKLVPAQT